MSSNAAKVRYLSASDLYHINFEVTEGDTLVRDLHLLNSAARRPMLHLFGEPQFPTIVDKAAALLHSLAYHHLFVDGNKRTAARAVMRFLLMNGCEPAWSDAEAQSYILEVAQGQHNAEAIAAWLAPRVRPLADV